MSILPLICSVSLWKKTTKYLKIMIAKKYKQRLIFYWITSFVIAMVSYYILWLIMPMHYVFGIVYRMPLYHWEFPIPFIMIPCFFYGITATLFSNFFAKQRIVGQILLTILVIFITILLTSPFGGMLWHFFDMLYGFFPKNWVSNMVEEGFNEGIGVGWFIILTSIPYNILGSIVCFYLTRKGCELNGEKLSFREYLNLLKIKK